MIPIENYDPNAVLKCKNYIEINIGLHGHKNIITKQYLLYTIDNLVNQFY